MFLLFVHASPMLSRVVSSGSTRPLPVGKKPVCLFPRGTLSKRHNDLIYCQHGMENESISPTLTLPRVSSCSAVV